MTNTSLATQTGTRLPTPAAGSVRDLLQSTAIKERFERVLGDPNKAALFVGSLATLVYASPALKECEPHSIIAAAIEAAAYDVPLGPTLGYAHLIPYNGKARFQPGWKLYVQLAHRTGQYQRIHVGELYEGQVRGTDPFTGELLRGERASDKVTGYIAYFKLTSGFEKHVYMTVDELDAHAKRYSKTYTRADSKWKTDFDAMARKTVLKALLSKWGPLSIQMQKIMAADAPPDDETPANGNGHASEAAKAALFGTEEDDRTTTAAASEPATDTAASVEGQPPMPEPPPSDEELAEAARQFDLDQAKSEESGRRRRR